MTINEAFLIQLVGVLAAALIGGLIGAFALVYKKERDIQDKIHDLDVEVHSEKPSKLNLHLLITIVLFFNTVIFILWIYILSRLFSSQIGHLRMFSIILYTIAVITLGSLIIIFYENLMSSLSIAENVLRREAAAFALSLSIAFLFVITTIYGYSLANVPDSVPTASVAPHNPQTFYFHLVLLICPLFLILTKKMTFKDMGFVFKKDTLTKGLLMGAGFLFLIPLFYLRTFLLPGTLDIKMGAPFLYFITAIALGPVSEEIFFRGILQTKFQNVRGISGGLAIFLSSLAHAFFHLPKILFASSALLISKQLPFSTFYPKYPAYYPFIAFFYFFFLSLYFGDVYRTTKSIYWPILAHSILNFILITFIIS